MTGLSSSATCHIHNGMSTQFELELTDSVLLSLILQTPGRRAAAGFLPGRILAEIAREMAHPLKARLRSKNVRIP